VYFLVSHGFVVFDLGNLGGIDSCTFLKLQERKHLADCGGKHCLAILCFWLGVLWYLGNLQFLFRFFTSISQIAVRIKQVRVRASQGSS
jgi:hypothetical protein